MENQNRKKSVTLRLAVMLALLGSSSEMLFHPLVAVDRNDAIEVRKTALIKDINDGAKDFIEKIKKFKEVKDQKKQLNKKLQDSDDDSESDSDEDFDEFGFNDNRNIFDPFKLSDYFIDDGLANKLRSSRLKSDNLNTVEKKICDFENLINGLLKKSSEKDLLMYSSNLPDMEQYFQTQMKDLHQKEFSLNNEKEYKNFFKKEYDTCLESFKKLIKDYKELIKITHNVKPVNNLIINSANGPVNYGHLPANKVLAPVGGTYPSIEDEFNKKKIFLNTEMEELKKTNDKIEILESIFNEKAILIQHLSLIKQMVPYADDLGIETTEFRFLAGDKNNIETEANAFLERNLLKLKSKKQEFESRKKELLTDIKKKEEAINLEIVKKASRIAQEILKKDNSMLSPKDVEGIEEAISKDLFSKDLQYVKQVLQNITDINEEINKIKELKDINIEVFGDNAETSFITKKFTKVEKNNYGQSVSTLEYPNISNFLKDYFCNKLLADDHLVESIIDINQYKKTSNGIGFAALSAAKKNFLTNLVKVIDIEKVKELKVVSDDNKTTPLTTILNNKILPYNRLVAAIATMDKDSISTLSESDLKERVGRALNISKPDNSEEQKKKYSKILNRVIFVPFDDTNKNAISHTNLFEEADVQLAKYLVNYLDEDNHAIKEMYLIRFKDVVQSMRADQKKQIITNTNKYCLKLRDLVQKACKDKIFIKEDDILNAIYPTDDDYISEAKAALRESNSNFNTKIASIFKNSNNPEALLQKFSTQESLFNPFKYNSQTNNVEEDPNAAPAAGPVVANNAGNAVIPVAPPPAAENETRAVQPGGVPAGVNQGQNTTTKGAVPGIFNQTTETTPTDLVPYYGEARDMNAMEINKKPLKERATEMIEANKAIAENEKQTIISDMEQIINDRKTKQLLENASPEFRSSIVKEVAKQEYERVKKDPYASNTKKEKVEKLYKSLDAKEKENTVVAPVEATPPVAQKTILETLDESIPAQWSNLLERNKTLITIKSVKNLVLQDKNKKPEEKISLIDGFQSLVEKAQNVPLTPTPTKNSVDNTASTENNTLNNNTNSLSQKSQSKRRASPSRANASASRRNKRLLRRKTRAVRNNAVRNNVVRNNVVRNNVVRNNVVRKNSKGLKIRDNIASKNIRPQLEDTTVNPVVNPTA